MTFLSNPTPDFHQTYFIFDDYDFDLDVESTSSDEDSGSMIDTYDDHPAHIDDESVDELSMSFANTNAEPIRKSKRVGQDNNHRAKRSKLRRAEETLQYRNRTDSRRICNKRSTIRRTEPEKESPGCTSKDELDLMLEYSLNCP